MASTAGAAFWLCLTGACVASTSLLSSNNLLPKAVCLHAAGAVACILLGKKQRWGPTAWAVTALSAWLVVRAVVSRGDTPGPTLDGVSALAVTLAVAAGVGRRGAYLGLFTAVALVSAVIAFIDAVVPLGLGAATRPSGLLASRSTAGAFTVAGLSLSLPRRMRWHDAVGLLLLSGMVVSTRARVAWAALAVVVLSFCVRNRSWQPVAVVGLAAFVITTTPWPEWQWASASPWHDSLASLATMDLGDRLDVWRASVRLVSPWGTGLGGYEAAFPTELDAVARIESPHNEALRAAVEVGVVASLLLAGIAMVALAPRRGFRAKRIWWAFLALLVCGLTGKTFSEPPTLALAAVLAGLLLRQRFRRHHRTRVYVGLARTGGLVLVLGMGAIDVNQLTSSSAQRRSERLQDAGQLRAAWEELEPTLDASRDMSPWLLAFELLRESGDVRRCEALAIRAKARWPVSGILQSRIRYCLDPH